MITAVTMQLLNLIFQQVLRLLLLTGRPSSTKNIESLVLRRQALRLLARQEHQLQYAGLARYVDLLLGVGDVRQIAH